MDQFITFDAVNWQIDTYWTFFHHKKKKTQYNERRGEKYRYRNIHCSCYIIGAFHECGFWNSSPSHCWISWVDEMKVSKYFPISECGWVN